MLPVTIILIVTQTVIVTFFGIWLLIEAPDAVHLPPGGSSVLYIGVVLVWGFVGVGSYAWLPDGKEVGSEESNASTSGGLATNSLMSRRVIVGESRASPRMTRTKPRQPPRRRRA